MNLLYMGFRRHRALDPDLKPHGIAALGQGRQRERDTADLGHDPSGCLANERREFLGKCVCRARLPERRNHRAQAAQAAEQADEQSPP